MTNLTEQWKKGELPEGWYYVKDIHNKEWLDRYFKETDNFEYLEDWEVGEVLAPVPSYEEWKSSDGLILTLMDNIKDKSDLLQLAMEKNAELKELLKECKHIMSIEKDFASCHFEKDKLCKLLTKINQVLGEE